MREDSVIETNHADMVQNTLTLLNATVNPLTCISQRFVAVSAVLLRYFGIISSSGRDFLQVVTFWDIYQGSLLVPSRRTTS